MPRRIIDTTRDPDTMTPEERREQIAAILAVGVARTLEISRKISVSSPPSLEDDRDARLTVTPMPAKKGGGDDDHDDHDEHDEHGA